MDKLSLSMRAAGFCCCLLLAACGDKHDKQDNVMTPAQAAAQPDPITGKAKMPVPPMTPSTPEAVASGKVLFVKMNCAGCHTYTGKGFMGPDLTDTYWRYGGAPDDIFRSIYEGRPQGMPAWGKALPTDQIWDLVHYIASLPVHEGGTPEPTSPATGTGIMVDSMPPSQKAAK
jgi:mono/diheme cytochrome c family protein